jgi:hypothetical protein
MGNSRGCGLTSRNARPRHVIVILGQEERPPQLFTAGCGGGQRAALGIGAAGASPRTARPPRVGMGTAATLRRPPAHAGLRGSQRTAGKQVVPGKKNAAGQGRRVLPGGWAIPGGPRRRGDTAQSRAQRQTAGTTSQGRESLPRRRGRQPDALGARARRRRAAKRGSWPALAGGARRNECPGPRSPEARGETGVLARARRRLAAKRGSWRRLATPGNKAIARGLTALPGFGEVMARWR